MPKPHYQKNRRVRIFGGPNGSGKSTILFDIDANYDIGYYINADLIEHDLRKSASLDLLDFGISDLSQHEFYEYLSSHTILKKAHHEGFPINIHLEGTKIINPDKQTHSYEAAFVADLLRYQLLARGSKFSFETVMSHESKLNFINAANQSGYKTYLYFISTESPIINTKRVEERVAKGGHPVAHDKIESRYFNSLSLLKQAVRLTYRAFIYDNSKDRHQLIVDVFNGSEVTYHYHEVPHWVDQYLLS